MTGMAMAPTDAAEPIEFAPKRAISAPQPEVKITPPPADLGPLRIRGRVGDGLYWSLRAAGASPQVAAQYLAALATEIDVGEVGASDSFVKGPFLLEGGMQGALGAAGAIALLAVLFSVMRDKLDVELATLVGVEPSFLPWPVIVALVGVGAMLGMMAAALGLRKLVNV
jgi:hypothetical protein